MPSKHQGDYGYEAEWYSFSVLGVFFDALAFLVILVVLMASEWLGTF